MNPVPRLLLLGCFWEKLFHLVEDGGCDHPLGRLLDPPLAAGRDDHDLVVRGVEADVLARDVVEDDEVDRLPGELLARARETLRTLVGREPDAHLAAHAPAA